MIIISLATSLSAASLPVITEYFTKGDRKNLGKLASESIQLFCLVMFPAITGMSIISVSVYTVFYGYDALGSQVLIACTISSLMSGFFMLSSVILQGMFKNKELLVELAIGFILKLVIQYPCIRLFEIYGPIISTTIAFLVTDMLIFRSIYKATDFDIKQFMKRLALILGMTLVMGIVTYSVHSILSLFISRIHRMGAIITFVICMGFGVMTYAYLVLKTRIGDVLLGAKMASLRAKLKIK